MDVWWCILCGLVTSCFAPSSAVMGGEQAAAPHPDDAVVFVQKHGRSARVEGIKDERLGYYTFFGIRFVVNYFTIEIIINLELL